MNQVGEDPEWGVMSLLLPVSTATDSAEKGLHWCAFILRGSLGAGVPERELSWSGVSVEHPHVPRGKQVDEVQALEETFLRIQDPSSLFRNVHQPSRQKRKHCHEGICVLGSMFRSQRGQLLEIIYSRFCLTCSTWTETLEKFTVC